jgi:hypothetical protein
VSSGLFSEFFLATLWLFFGLRSIILAPRKYTDPRGKQLIRIFGWEWVAVSLLMYLTIAIGLRTRHDQAAMIVFYALLSLSILCSGAYGFIYQSVTGNKSARPLRWVDITLRKSSITVAR